MSVERAVKYILAAPGIGPIRLAYSSYCTGEDSTNSLAATALAIDLGSGRGDLPKYRISP
jgi:hypothetical protein